MKQFLETSFQNVRSSRRTDELHTVLLDEILRVYPSWKRYDWHFEGKLERDAFGGTFDIDIVAYDGPDLKVAILAKAINSNINKNIKNYANTTIGEAARLVYAPGCHTLDKVLFVSILPRVAPRFNKHREVVGFDDVVSAKNRTNIQKVLEAQYGIKVEAIDLFYDIENVRNLNDFDVIGVQNLETLEEKVNF